MRWVSRPVPSTSGHADCVVIDGEHNDVDEASSGPLMRKIYSLERRWMLGAVLRDQDAICGSSEELVWLKLKNGNVVAARVADVLHANHSADVRSCTDLATLEHLHLPAATRALQEASAQGTRAIFAGDTLVYLANNETCSNKEGKGLLATLERSGPILEYADAVRMTMHAKQENQIILVTGPSGTGKTKAAEELARALMTGNSCLRRGTTAACRVMQAFTSSMDARGSLRSRALVTAEISYASTGDSLSRAPCASQVSTVFFEPWRATTCIPEESLAVLRLMSTSLDADSCARLGLEPPSQCSSDATCQKESDLMAHLMEDMETAGLDVADRLHIFSTLAAVLHLGKLSFIQRSDGRVVVAAPRRGLRGRTRPRSTGSSFLLRRSTSSSSFKWQAPMQEDKGKVSPGIPMSGPPKASHVSLLPPAATTTTSSSSSSSGSGSGSVDFGSSGLSKVHSESAKGQMSSILMLKRHSRSSRGPWTENLPPQRKVTQNGHALVLRESEPILRRHGSGPLRRRPTGLGGHQSAEDVLVAGGERRLSALGQLQGTPLEKAAFLLGLETAVLEDALCVGTKDPAMGERKAQALAKSVFWGVLRWVEQRVNQKLGELEPLTNGTRSVTIVDCLSAAADREHGGIDESRPFENTLADAVGVAIEHDIFDHAVLGKTAHGTSYPMEVLFGSIAGGGLLARLEDEFADAANYRGHTGHGERVSASSSREAEHEMMSRTASMSMSSASTEASSSSMSSLLGLHRQEDFLDHVEFQEHRISGPENAYVAAHEGDFAEKNQLGHWQSLLAKSVQQFTKELPLPEKSQVVTLYRRDVGRLVSWLMDYGVNVHFVRCIRVEDSKLAATEALFMKKKSSAFEVGSCCLQGVMKQVADSKLVEVARKHRAGRFLHSVSVQSILQPYRAHLPLADLRRDSQTVVEGILYALGMDKAFIQIGPKDAAYSSRSIHTVQSLLRPSEEQLTQMRAARIRASWRRCLAAARACSHFLTMFKASRQRSEAATTINRLARRVARSEIMLRRVQAARVIQRSLRRFRACKHARAHLNELRTFACVKAAKRAIRVRARETALFLRRRSSSSGSISQ